MSKSKPPETVGQMIDRPFFNIVFQHGPVDEVGVNGCRVEDVIDALVEKLREYQSGHLACAENEETMDFLELAKLGQLRRRKLRQDQGVLNTLHPHQSLFDHRTEDEEQDFSATGA